MNKYYKILGLTPPSSKEQVKKRFRELAKIHHPDKGGDAIKFAEIKDAYEAFMQRDYWTVVQDVKPPQRGKSWKPEVFVSDDGTEFWTEDENGFVKDFWTRKKHVYESDWMSFDMSSKVKEQKTRDVYGRP